MSAAALGRDAGEGGRDAARPAWRLCHEMSGVAEQAAAASAAAGVVEGERRVGEEIASALARGSEVVGQDGRSW